MLASREHPCVASEKRNANKMPCRALGLTRVCRSTLGTCLKVDVEHNALPGTGLPPSKKAAKEKKAQKKAP